MHTVNLALFQLVPVALFAGALGWACKCKRKQRFELVTEPPFRPPSARRTPLGR